MAATWAPGTDAVAALLSGRVASRDTAGFDATTTPTDQQVLDLVDQVVADVVARVGPFDPDAEMHPGVTLGDQARQAVALGAASLIELSYYPDQSAEGGSAYERLFERYEAAVGRLAAAVTEVAAGGITAAPGRSLAPTFSFPDVVARTSTAF